MNFNLDIIFIIIISMFVFGLVIAANYYLYISPRRSGLKWALWLGGMFLGGSVFDMVLTIQLIQQESPPLIWIILINPLTVLFVFILNLFTQWLKYRDFQSEVKADETRINGMRNAL